MKNWLIGPFTFLLAIAIGVIAAGHWLTGSSDFDVPPIGEEEVVACAFFVDSPPVADDFVPEFVDLPNFEDIVYPEYKPNLMDFWETDGIVWVDRYDVKAGERWLVLAKDDSGFRFGHAKARPQTILDEDSRDILGINPNFKVKGKAVLAARNIRNLKPGKASVVYQRRAFNELDAKLKIGAIRKYDLDGVTWRLRVTKGVTKDGMRVGVLTLSDGSREQIVTYSAFFDDYEFDMGDVLIAGDLDNDGKLDLYLEGPRMEESFGNGLYLSTHATANQHVGLAAYFSYGGC